MTSRDDQLATALENAMNLIKFMERTMGVEIDESIYNATSFDPNHARSLIDDVRERPFSQTAKEAKTLLERLYNVLDAAGSDCMDVAANSKAHGHPTVWAAQAQERVDIIRELCGDARWSPRNPLKTLIDNAAEGSQKTRVASMTSSSNNNGEHLFGVEIGKRTVFESYDYDRVEDMVSRINSSLSRP